LLISASSLPGDLFAASPLTVACTLGNVGRQLTFNALVDTGATGYSFIDEVIAQTVCDRLKIEPQRLLKPKPLKGFDGRPGQAITHAIYPTMTVHAHVETVTPMLITSLGNHPIILGKPWMNKHHVMLDMTEDKVVFGKENCCSTGGSAPNSTNPVNGSRSGPLPRAPRSYLGNSTPQAPLLPYIRPTQILQRQNSPTAQTAGSVYAGGAGVTLVRRPCPPSGPPVGIGDSIADRKDKGTRRPFGLVQIDPIPECQPTPSPRVQATTHMQKRKKTELEGQKRPFCTPTNARIPSARTTRATAITAPTKNTVQEDEPLDICEVSPLACKKFARRPGVEVFMIHLHEVEERLRHDEKEPTAVLEKLPPTHHAFADVFDRKTAENLPPHRPYDHKIVLEDKLTMGHGPMYNMSGHHLQLVKEYLEANLDKGFIQASAAPYSSPILFVKKPNGALRFCVDYRKLNAITKKDRYPLPLIDETMAQLQGAKFFTKLDIISAFNNLRMDPDSEELTTFKTRFGAYKYRVLPFGLTNGPASWQRFMNDTFFQFLDDFCSVYLDDILIYSKTYEEHVEHVNKVLARLREAGLQVDIDKSEFHVTETKFLGLIISVDGIKMDPAKIQTIVEWEEPKTLKQVQAFLGFCNFYRRFIRNFAKIAKPLVRLTRKDMLFDFDKACQAAFDLLKKTVTEGPVLAHFDREKKSYLETDSSDYVNSGVLSQYGEDGLLHPVAFFSKNLNPAECNYEIYDKELLAIVKCFEQWRPELEATGIPVSVFTDHKSLEYFMTTKKLTRRQARWAEALSEFNFVITYRPGKQNEKADALTRRPNDKPQDDSDERQKHQLQTMLPMARLSAEVQQDCGLAPIESDTPEPEEIPIHDQIVEANLEDDLCDRISRGLAEGLEKVEGVKLNLCSIDDRGCVLYQGRLWVPELADLRLNVIRQTHDQPAVGHPGIRNTLSMASRVFFWPRMRKDVEQYVQNCHTCRRSKAPRDKYNGLLHPLPIPQAYWKDISMDFVVGLPESHSCNAILVVVDRLSKERHYIACTDKNNGTSAENTAKMLMEHVWKYHGLPTSIISDRGTQFTSLLWKTLCKSLGITAKLSTSFHPETDGQSEIANQEMERYLRTFCNYGQDDWTTILPVAEFAANNMTSTATRMTPFFATRGYNPRMSFDPVDASKASTRERLMTTKAIDISKRTEAAMEAARQFMKQAQDAYARAANVHRKDVSYKVGDLVWLSTKNIQTERQSKKLDHKVVGPYRVMELIGSACRLQLPASMKIHNVFHTWLLRKDPNDPLPGQINAPPPPVVVEPGTEEWEVERILDAKKVRGVLKFKVGWKGYPPDPEWYNADGFGNSADLINAFYKQYPQKPRA